MVGDKLKELRKSQHRTQQEVSDILGISRSAIAMYECNAIEPNIKLIKKFCLLYKVTSDELLEINSTN